jgi:hypothetical protein
MSHAGKFESEPSWVELLWDLAMAGFSDKTVHDGSLTFDGFVIDYKMAELTGYSEDPDRYIVLWENDDGFVSHTVLSSQELDNIEGFDLDEDTGHWMPGIDPEFDELGGEDGF